MRVKEAVLTFVAMGGFAVPVLFQTPSTEGSVAPEVAAQTSTPTGDDKEAKKA